MKVGELEQSYSKIKEFIQELLPSAVLKSSFNGNFIYHVRSLKYSHSKPLDSP